MSDLEQTQETTSVSDGCPAWADDLIRKIYLIEVETGTLPNPKDGQWTTKSQQDLLKVADRLEKSSGADLDGEAEALFIRVVKGLMEEDFTPEEAAQFINVRVPTGTKLNYCNASEVLEAFED